MNSNLLERIITFKHRYIRSASSWSWSISRNYN